MAPPGGTAPNAAAAGATAGSYAKAVTRGHELGHGAYSDGHAAAIDGARAAGMFWTGSPPSSPGCPES